MQTWICTVAMLLGRLEIFSVLVLFTADVLAQVNRTASAADVGLEVRDRAFLFFDDGAHQVADRQHADHALPGDHRQVPDAHVGHEPHAVVASCAAVTVTTLEVMMASTRVSLDERPNNTTLRA